MGKGGEQKNLLVKAQGPHLSTANIQARSLSVKGHPEHCGVLSCIPGPQPDNAKSTPSVTITDVPR